MPEKKTSISVEQLSNNPAFKLFSEVNYQQLLPFLIPYMKRLSVPMIFFYGFNLLFLGDILFLFQKILSQASLSLFQLFSLWGVSFLLTLLLIPIHELLHGVAFKILGAKHLTFGVNWNYLMFYVTSDGMVLSKSQFYFLALVPFCVISGLLSLFLFSSSAVIQWTTANVLFAHATCCIGDFSLMSFFYVETKGKNAFTYDNVEKMTSYFYIEKGTND